jgi:hypothetical protein
MKIRAIVTGATGMVGKGVLHPDLKNTLPYYKYLSWMYPVVRKVFPNFVSTLGELGQAMLNITLRGYSRPILEVKDIVATAQKA